MSRDVCDCYNWEGKTVQSSEERPERLLNILQFTEQLLLSDDYNYLAQNVSSAEDEKPFS